MKIVLDTPNNQFSFVKAMPVPARSSNEKTLFLAEFGKAIDELNDVLAGKTQAADAYSLLNELLDQAPVNSRRVRNVLKVD